MAMSSDAISSAYAVLGAPVKFQETALATIRHPPRAALWGGEKNKMQRAMFWGYLGGSVGITCPCMFPCFWMPCTYCVSVVMGETINNTILVLTDAEIVSIQLDSNECCCKGISTSGTVVKSMPLEMLTEIKVMHPPSKGAAHCLEEKTVSGVQLFTPSSFRPGSGDNGPSTVPEGGVATDRAAVERFAEALRGQIRERINAHQSQAHQGGAPQQQLMAAEPAQQDPGQRLAAVQRLHEQGILSDEEFQAKRKEIVATM